MMDNQKPAAIASYQCGLFANHGQMSGINYSGLLANPRNVAAINWLAAIKGLVLLASKLLHKLQDIVHQLSHAILC
ncbi:MULTISPECIES: hypothetical protein [Pantoea]|uniref:hypothetical protein n=1 Tax=Pantoea TaxID=53335 RepID=UPI0015FBFE26|nr:hypothetical protein [Pantoea pleuroti]MBB1228824.1 hypothetical protein [Pantoea pleuroti]